MPFKKLRLLTDLLWKQTSDGSILPLRRWIFTNATTKKYHRSALSPVSFNINPTKEYKGSVKGMFNLAESVPGSAPNSLPLSAMSFQQGVVHVSNSNLPWLFPLSAWNNQSHKKRSLDSLRYLGAAGLVGYSLQDDSSSLPPLLDSARKGDLDAVINQIEKNGANVNLVAGSGDPRSALFFAAANGYHKVVKYLIEQGAKVDVLDQDRQTILHVIAAKPNLAKHADVDYEKVITMITTIDPSLLLVENQEHRVPLEVAKVKKNEDLASIFLSKVWLAELSKDPSEISQIVGEIAVALPKIKSVAGQNVFLVLGNTGAGKSTQIRRLMGQQFSMKITGLMQTIPQPLNDDPKYPKIGDGTNSQTTYPESFIVKNGESELVLCDCPGFGDSRGKNIITSIGTQLATKSANKIAGIVVVIDMYSLLVDCAKSLKDLSLTLNNILEEQYNIKESVLFVITKCPPGLKKERVLDKVSEIIEGGIATHKGKITPEMDLLSKISADNLIIIDIYSEDNRQEVLQQLQQLTEIPKDKLYFGRHDSVHVEFNKTIFDIVDVALKLSRKIQEIPKIIKDKQNIIQETEQNIADSEKLINGFKSGNFERDKAKQISDLSDAISRHKLQLEVKNKKIVELSATELYLKKELAALDTAEPALFWDEGAFTLQPSGVFGEAISRTAEKSLFIRPEALPAVFLIETLRALSNSKKINSIPFTYKNPSVPLIAVTKEVRNGKVEEYGAPTQDKPSHEYRLTYTLDSASGASEGGRIHVKGYTEKRLLPANQASIRSLKDQLAANQTAKQGVEAERADLINKIEEDTLLISNIRDGLLKGQHSLSQEIAKQEANQQNLTKAKVELEAEISKLQIELGQAKQKFRVNQDLFKVIYDFAQLMEYDEKLMHDFCQEIGIKLAKEPTVTIPKNPAPNNDAPPSGPSLR